MGLWFMILVNGTVCFTVLFLAMAIALKEYYKPKWVQ